MAQNITIAGNQYPSVPSILIPKTGGGGNAIFADPSVVTAVAADVASGKYFLDSSGVLTQGTASGGSAVIQSLSVTQNGTYTAPTGVDGYSPVTVNVSGGGGASNIVTGTFTGTTTGAAMDVTLNYSGNGYPIVVSIYPTEGPYNSSEGSFYNLVQRYVVGWYSAVKNQQDTIPGYTGNNNNNTASTLARYKSNTSSATSYTSSTGSTTQIYNDTNATDTAANIVKIRSKNKLSVYIANTSYGFAANIEYTYYVIYSS